MKKILEKNIFKINFDRGKYKKNIFVCYTPFHLLMSILISFILTKNNNETFDVVVGKDHFNYACDIIRNIKNNVYWINEVYGINDKKVTKKINQFNYYFRKIIKLIYLKEFYRVNEPKIERIKFNNNCRIFLFHDSPLLSLYFLKSNASNYVLVEDGKANYSKSKDNSKSNYFRKIFGFYKAMGRHPKIKNILVQNPNALPKDIRKKGIKLDLDQLINGIMNEKDKNMICNIFPGYKEFNIKFLKYKKSKRKMLLLTQPLLVDGLIDESEKIKYYTKIVNKYSNDYIIFLKPHPRENTLYKKYFDNRVIILQKQFPVELFQFNKNIRFDLAISHSSSAIDNLSCIKNKITLNKSSRSG